MMPASGVTIRQRDIILVLFPYSDFSDSKERPAIVISNNEYNDKSQDIICCAVTSNPRNYYGTIDINNRDLEYGSLKLNCKVRSNKIFTLDKGEVTVKIGRLNIKKSLMVIKEIIKTISQ